MDRLLALLATFGIGALIAFQPPSNALLARHVPALGAAFFSLMVSTAIVGVLLLLSGQVGGLSGLSELRPAHLIGGIGGAAVVAGTIPAVRVLGAAGLTAALVTTQLTVSLLIDRFSLLDVRQADITTQRLGGVVLLLLGTWLMTSR